MGIALLCGTGSSDGDACGDQEACTCLHESSLFCINYSECGTTFKPGICQSTDFHLQMDINVLTKDPSNFDFHKKPQKCCHWKKDPDAENSLEANLAEVMVNPRKNWEVFAVGLALGASLTLSVGGGVLLVIIHLRRRRGYSRQEPLLVAA